MPETIELVIVRVANGFMVYESTGDGKIGPMASIHVFRSWAQASGWIKRKVEAP